MTLYTGFDLLDGDGWHQDMAIRIEGGAVVELRPRAAGDAGEDLSGDALICPGFIDLQVNGGAGRMLSECRTVGDVSGLARAHLKGGTLGLLPTLISDTPQTTTRIIDLVADAARADPAILGLHLEGPHLAVAGAHDPSQLRPMTEADLALYLDAAPRLPRLMITLAPEQATTAQIARLAGAGILVSLGHTGCSYEEALAAFDAGARGTTHLFNAMSGLHHRAPGLVGAALDRARVIGLIADRHHVHPSAMRLALKARPGAICLVSDAMAVAGTGEDDLLLNGRRITRAAGRLTLADGTLAGADLTLWDAVQNLVSECGLPLEAALPHAFDTPHRALHGAPNRVAAGQPVRLLMIREGRLAATHTGDGWQPV